MSFFQFFSKGSHGLLNVDIHSHLIPGIDDGAKDIERSIELILSLKEMGYTKLITTPHVSDMFPNSSQTILDGYHLLCKELETRDIKIDLEIAAEYYADEGFDQLLKNKDILSFGKKNYLLFELSYFTEPQDLESLIQEIKLAGYTPILAHPERYEYFHYTIQSYKDLKKTGVLFQMNLNSLVGYYSKTIEKVAKQLIQEGLVDFLGSDTHHRRHIRFLKESLNSATYKTLFKKNTILNNTL